MTELILSLKRTWHIKMSVVTTAFVEMEPCLKPFSVPIVEKKNQEGEKQT